MSKPKSLPIVVFIDRNRMQWFRSDVREVLTFDIPANIMRDLTIVNAYQLERIMDAVITKYQFGPSKAVIVLSDSVYYWEDFEKGLSYGDEVTEFHESVPFESYEAREEPLQGGKIRAYAFPKDMYEQFKRILETRKFQIAGVYPVAFLGQMAGKRWLDADMGKYVLDKQSELKNKNLLSENDLLPEITEADHAIEASNKRTPYLIGVFVVLIGILVVMILRGT